MGKDFMGNYDGRMKDSYGDEIRVQTHYSENTYLKVFDDERFATAILSPKKVRKLIRKLEKALAVAERK